MLYLSMFLSHDVTRGDKRREVPDYEGSLNGQHRSRHVRPTLLNPRLI